METPNKPQKWCQPFGTQDLLTNSNGCDKSWKLFKFVGFFSLFKEIKCSSHIKRWGDFLNNSTVFFLLYVTKELKNIKRKCFTKSRKTTDTTIPHSEQLDHDKVKIGVQEDEEEEDDIKAYE